MFKLGEEYTKKDLYLLLNVPTEKQKGAWDTGYRKWNNAFYLFANIGTQGRAGTNYNNYWDGNNLMWYAKRSGSLMKELTDPNNQIFLFTRSNNRSPFIFQGEVIAKSFSNKFPYQILWSFKMEIFSVPKGLSDHLLEGTYNRVSINQYERNPEARRQCIRHYGPKCQVCGFTFDIYGNVGQGYIHVHHLKLISSIKQEYIIDPINDLRPVCANCHSVLHLKDPPYEIEELKELLRRNEGKSD